MLIGNKKSRGGRRPLLPLFLHSLLHESCTPMPALPPGYAVGWYNALVSIASPPHSGRPAACVVIPGVHAFLLPSVASHSHPEGVLQHGSPWPIEGYRPVRFRF